MDPKPFNLIRHAASQGAACLSFGCTACGARCDRTAAERGCACGGKLFRVAKFVDDPYRSTSTEEDGYKTNNPGTQGEIGESGLGSTRFRNDEAGFDEFQANNYIPKDGSPYDDFGVGGNSDKFMDMDDGSYSPLSPANRKDRKAPGPLGSGIAYRQEGDLFEHIRRKRKDWL